MKKTITLGENDFMFGVHVENSVMKVAFGPHWEDHLRGADFEQLLKGANDKLQRLSKGNSKGRKGKAGKLPVDFA